MISVLYEVKSGKKWNFKPVIGLYANPDPEVA
jgi:hypothetical protein